MGSLAAPTALDASSNVANFPAATGNTWYIVTGTGWLGGAAGVGLYVYIGDMLYCNTTSSSDTRANVGAYWNLFRSVAHQLIDLNAGLSTVLL